MHDNLLDKTFSRFPHFDSPNAKVQLLEKGGSDRKFYRIAAAGGISLILVKYGNLRDENRHYVAIAQFLTGIGFRSPQIFFHDESEGLIWMEDLGDRDLWSYRDEPWAVRRALYENTLDGLLTLHTRAHVAYNGHPPTLQAEFNTELYRWEQNYFFENCLGRFFNIDTETLAEACDRERLEQIAELLAAKPRVLVHRDFQSQNIVIKEGAACFIDFQGMRPGLAQYDLASLLHDPYVSLSESERAELLAYYIQGLRELGFEPAPDFEETFRLCAMQRLMQALGAYGFLGLVKERPRFLEHIPPALKSLRGLVAQIPGLAQLDTLLAGLKFPADSPS
ncbi:MAG: Aminoglycoside phosphotransferase [Chthoniobacteraceae bacterium]|nr:Aminoglycoside phosphotransferase [Chthoniobacteraceae bacterium]